MTRDAVDAVQLPTDPCVRIRFPQDELCEDDSACSIATSSASIRAYIEHRGRRARHRERPAGSCSPHDLP
jgi:hypothetical protein